MRENIYSIPVQTVSYADKIKDDYKFAKDTALAYVRLANFEGEEYQEMDKILRVIEGDMEATASEYKHITNPFNTKNEKYTAFPAKLRHLPLIEPVIQLYLGDVLSRFKIEQVVAINSDVEVEKKNIINIELEKYYTQKMINFLNTLGVNTGVPSKEIPIKDILEEIVSNFDDKLSIQGQDLLEYLYYNLEIDDKVQEYAYYWFSVGRVATYKGNRLNDVEYRVIHPCDVWFTDNNTTYGEDKDAAVEKLRFTKTQLIREYYDEIGNDASILKKIEDITNADELRKFNAITFRDGSVIKKLGRDEDSDNFIIGYRVEWTSFRKEGILYYIDELGQSAEKTVDETYKLDKEKGDISITWMWVDEKWSADVFGDDLFFRVGPVDVQRNEINNRCSGKLRYNERRTTSKTQKVASIGKTGYPFQIMYNMLHYNWEKIVNKNKDKILMMPLSLVPKGAGWSTDKFMYMASALSFAFFDDTADNAAAMVSAMKQVDLSLGQYLKETYDLMQSLKSEFWDAVGMNRQRFGEIQASDGKATTEQALFRSALVSAESFRQLDKFKEKDAQGLIDVARFSYLNGKKGTYISPDGLAKTIELTEDFISLTELGVFATNNDKERQKVQEAKAMGLPLLQNNGSYSAYLEVVDTDNFSKIKKYVKKEEKIRQKYEQSKAAAEQKTKDDQNVIAAQMAQDKKEVEIYKADKQYDAILDAKMLEFELTFAKLEKEGIFTKDELDIKRKELEFQYQELKSKERMNTENNQTKRATAKKSTSK